MIKRLRESRDPWKQLGVPAGCGKEDVNRAYRLKMNQSISLISDGTMIVFQEAGHDASSRQDRGGGGSRVIQDPGTGEKLYSKDLQIENHIF